MGESKSKLKGYINFDINASEGISDDVKNLSKYFGKSTISKIVANNPMAPFLEHVTNSLKSGGTITIRGQFRNRHFANVWDSESIQGYTIISRSRGISSDGYTKSDGSPINGMMNEIILRKN